jgi:hypothetical protein
MKSDKHLFAALEIGRKLERLRRRERELREELERACGKWMRAYDREVRQPG